MALALYRKYRPKTLSDMLGHESNIAILQNAAKTGRVSHAYLFYGSRGTGKTTTARLLAKLLNCEKRDTDEKFRAKGEPCNKCVPCEEIDSGRSLNVIEIDAASNRGIDEIRSLKENVRSSPAGSKFKVYIIDEAHMLTGPAFNALLKTLEEPPEHAVFILATTEYEKLPSTITSRVQRFLFKKATKIQILKKLESIVKAEKIKISPEALELVAVAGEGSFRDAESILDQLSSIDNDITLEDAELLLGRVGIRKVEDISRLIVAKDAKSAVKFLADLNDEGINIVQFIKDLIHYLRKALSLKLNPSLEESFGMELTSDEISTLKEIGKDADEAFLISTIRALIKAYAETRYSPFAMVPLELALMEQLEK